MSAPITWKMATFAKAGAFAVVTRNRGNMPGHGYIPAEMPSKKTLSVDHGLCPAEYNTL